MNKKILSLLFFFCVFNLLYSQKIPSTLLWKISGKGLQKPSYLYGTMHLTDERIFNIGDSVYKAIEQSDGFANEIDMDQLTPLVIDEAKKSALESLKIKDMMQQDKYKKYIKAIAKKIGKKESEITSTDILHEKNKWIEDSYSTGAMETFLDIYLLDIARREGKWTGGIEDLQDQEDVLDLFDESDLQELAINDDHGSSNENTMLNVMVKAYTDNNLDAIDSISTLGDSTYTDALLIKRNKKMAVRIDSLSRERSIVFAIGAAHLPGREGLIQLLKEKGFTIEPVFSSKKIKPANYKVAEKERPWYKVEDDAKHYAALMPGKAGDLNMYSILNMKMYFDVFKSTVYMTTALPVPYSESSVDSIFSHITPYYFGIDKYSKGSPIIIDNVPGREFYSKKTNYGHGYLLYKNGILYIAIAMSMKQDSSASSSINKFLHSFRINEILNTSQTDFSYVNKLKAYSIKIPGEPKSANDLVKAKPDTTLQSDLNIAVDPVTGAYYFFGCNEAAKGFSITNDSATLVQIRKSQNEKFNTVIVDTIYMKSGHRMMDLSGIMKQAPLMLKAHYEFRGNRWYSMVAMFDTAKANTRNSAENFFNSFQMLDYADKSWEKFTSADKLFTTWSPSSFVYVEKISDNGDTTVKYESYDTTRANTFNLIVQHFDKYYWESNDSTFWKTVITEYKNSNVDDSILYIKPVANGEAHGYEFALQETGSHNIKRVRKLLNDDKLYSLVTIQDSSEINNDNNNSFFENFRFNQYHPSKNIFISKSETLLKDIVSADSSIAQRATMSISSASFTKEDLPLLHQAVLKTYHVNEYGDDDVRDDIKKRIIDFADTTSYNFAKNNYGVADDSTKVALLDIMSSYASAAHFNDIKTLLLNKPPHLQPRYIFINNFIDTIQLTATIFPAMMEALNNTALTPVVLRLAAELSDSGLLDKSILQNYQTQILQFAKKQYAVVKDGDAEYEAANYSLLKILGLLNNNECNSMLQQWSGVKDIYLQMNAATSLLQNKQVVSPVVIKTLAADKTSRIDIYDSLKTYNKLSLFPATYLTQKSFAESLVYVAASDDEDPDEILFLTQKTINFKGRQSKFYFFKVTYSEDDDATIYLACAGPFNVNPKDMSTENATGEMYYDGEYDSDEIQTQSQAILSQMEEWFKWENEK